MRTFLSLALLLPLSCSALEVRVASPEGAPRILVNGEPVRARMFWGAPGSEPIKIGPQNQHITFDFTSAGSAANGTMHFRFGQLPGDIYLDEIEVRDLDDGEKVIAENNFAAHPEGFARDWRHWPVDASNTVGTLELSPAVERPTLRVHIQKPPDGVWPDFHLFHEANMPLVEGHRYRVSFRACATSPRNLEIGFYQPGTSYLHLGGPADPFQKQIALAAKAGINFVSFPTALPWPEPGKPVDWSAADASCSNVLRVNPNALLLPRIPMDPPAWWCKAHPDEVMRWEEGSHGNYAVPASPLYRIDASARLAALVEHLESRFGDHIAGYHPAGQNTGEWFYEATWKRPLNGYAPADLIAWRAWLQKRHPEEPTYGTAEVPTPAERHASPNGEFRDPNKEQRLIEWAQYQQEAMAGCVCDLAHAARTASKGKKLVVFFYGYVFEFGPVPTTPATSGHYALKQVLDSPDIDVLCSPISYFDRGLGKSAPSMSAAESVELAGKLWLNEDDTHGYLATGDPPGSQDHVATRVETIAELTRNVGEEATRNFGTWWMDLTSTGWFNDPEFWAQMARLRALDEPLLRHPHPFRPEIVVLIDTDRALTFTEKGRTRATKELYEVRAALGRIGAPYGQYLLSDPRAANLGKLRLVLPLREEDVGKVDLTSAGLRAAAQKAGVHL